MGKTTKGVLVVAAAALVGFAGYRLLGAPPEPGVSAPEEGPQASSGEVTVYKSAACGCCRDWVTYLREHGFTVEAKDVSNVAAVKVELGVPPQLHSCHTAVVDGYVVEGHVPVEAIRRLLEERPDVVGLAVPGMPIGSPGMEMAGRPADSYDIVAFDEAGNSTVYDRR